MSERLADVKSTSSKLAAAMANDELPVAKAVLERSESLEDKDLQRIAEIKEQGHLLAIANRDHVSNDLSKLLIKRGNKDVKQTIAANLGGRTLMNRNSRNSSRKCPNSLVNAFAICASPTRS